METPAVNSSRNQAQGDDGVQCVSLITRGPGYPELMFGARRAADEAFMFLSPLDSGCIHYSSVTADVSLLNLFVCCPPQSSLPLPVLLLRCP